MKRREKACLQKHAQSSRTSYPKGRASLTTSAPVKKKKWEGRKCQRLLWEWKGDQGGEGFQSRKRKRRIRLPAPFQILRRRYSRSVVPKPASYPSNHQRKEGDIFLDRSWQRSKNGYPMLCNYALQQRWPARKYIKVAWSSDCRRDPCNPPFRSADAQYRNTQACTKTGLQIQKWTVLQNKWTQNTGQYYDVTKNAGSDESIETLEPNTMVVRPWMPDVTL